MVSPQPPDAPMRVTVNFRSGRWRGTKKAVSNALTALFDFNEALELDFVDR
jgi:hypothetical protein